MKSYWVTVGVGTLIAIAGGAVYMLSDERFGVIVGFGGLIIAIMGFAMWLVAAYAGDKLK